MALNKPLLNFIIEKELLDKIEDFRFKNRFQTRAAAIKWLLAWALKQKPSPKTAPVQVAEVEDPPPLPPMPEAKAPEAKAPVAEAIALVAEAIAPVPAALEPVREVRIEPAPLPPRVAPEPSRESAIQELNDQGYEVGETVQHPDGKMRIAVRSKDGSAWVNVDQELADFAAGRITLREVAMRRAAGG